MDLVAACEAFVSVAERGSFTRGAAAVGMSQPGASRRIAALERHLGVPLLDRSGRSPALTPAGHRVLEPARQVLRASETLLLEAEEAGLRSLHLAVPTGCDVRERGDAEDNNSQQTLKSHVASPWAANLGIKPEGRPFPSLHHCKEGWLRPQEISRSHLSGRRRGGFPFVRSRKNYLVLAIIS